MNAKMTWVRLFLMGVIVAAFSACSESDPPTPPPPPEEVKTPTFKLGIILPEDIPLLTDITVTYVDTEGVKHTEVIAGTSWSKTITGTTLPSKAGYRVQLTRKPNLSFDKEAYTVGAVGMNNTVLLGSDVLDASYFSGSLSINKSKIEAYLQEACGKATTLVYEIKADGTLNRDATINWGD